MTLQYFSQLAIAAEATLNFSPQQATSMHDNIVNEWQKHVAMVLGKPLRSVSRLVAVLDDIITRADLAPGDEPSATMRLALHNAASQIECSAPLYAQGKIQSNLPMRTAHTDQRLLADFKPSSPSSEMPSDSTLPPDFKTPPSIVLVPQ